MTKRQMKKELINAVKKALKVKKLVITKLVIKNKKGRCMNLHNRKVKTSPLGLIVVENPYYNKGVFENSLIRYEIKLNNFSIKSSTEGVLLYNHLNK